MRIILDEQDAARLLSLLYNGRKPRRVHTLICACGAVADLRQSPKAWNGWQVLPHAVCPCCIEQRRPFPDEQPYPLAAEEQFLGLVGTLHSVSVKEGRDVEIHEMPDL